jgi:two-component sensor histidine kinase
MRPILNVDDTEALRYAKSRALKQSGYAVLEAGTAKEALELIARERPDLVLLDVKLPDLNGLEVCKIIKTKYPGTIVVQVSATFVGPADRVRGLNIGADAYLTEPLSSEELIANVRAMLRLKHAEAEKERLARQNELLFRELNHRVKNNLQLVSSLLSVQGRRISDPTAREQFKVAQQRIRTIASLHTRLYRDLGEMGSVSVQAYLGDLCGEIRSLMLTDRPGIELTVTGDDITLDIDKATSIGLIVNELVSNATKHAFGRDHVGEIRVELKRDGGSCVLCIGDSGRGNEKSIASSKGTGLKLVELLAAQIGATVVQEWTPGMRVTIRFAAEAADLIGLGHSGIKH